MPRENGLPVLHLPLPDLLEADNGRGRKPRRLRPRRAISLGKSNVVAYSNSQSPREYEFATDTRQRGARDLSRNVFLKTHFAL